MTEAASEKYINFYFYLQLDLGREDKGTSGGPEQSCITARAWKVWPQALNKTVVVILMIFMVGFLCFLFVWFSFFNSSPNLFSEFQSHLCNSLLVPLGCLMEI